MTPSTWNKPLFFVLVWSVHGHGSVVTRKSWKEGAGGDQQFRSRKDGEGWGWEEGKAKEGPSQLGVRPG